MITPMKILDVKPKIPEELETLKKLSENLWFVWNYDAQDLFRRINPDLWAETRKNPVEFICRMKQHELKGLTKDEGFLAHMERVKQEFDRYLSEEPHNDIYGKGSRPFLVAYFTAECGVADCLPIFSGGLGILSGDHLKSASDLNFPIVGVSLAYQRGYFRQYLSQDGWQMETYPVNQFTMMPMNLIRDDNGDVIYVSVDMKGEEVKVQAWEVKIGRTMLFLLDTNIKENSDLARGITSRLYWGDGVMRIRQEIVLGMGGVQMLHAIGMKPTVYHMNEGHSAFANFQRIRELREDVGLTFNEALEMVRTTSIFTTHTPVPAGIDTFPPDLIRAYFESLAESLGVSFDVLLGFGKQDPRKREDEFSMAVLALRLSNWNNGVSRLHGDVSRKMWRNIWPNTPEIDLPIVHITNGVHIPSWISKGMSEIYDRYLGPRWVEDPDNVKVWERVDKIPNTELWRTHERARERLVTFTRNRLRGQLLNRGVPDRDLAVADEVLNAETLTIGFARRFASYKRPYLILKEIERLKVILTDEKHPVQMIFAGKAHPQDKVGKEFIKNLVDISNLEGLRRRIVFLEDYDLEIARHMVQGMDIWLNTPRRLQEACGTSGMKAVANGALHFSVLDGWWDEGYDREIGWAIGSREGYEDHDYQDNLESRTVYDILEKDIVPLFYDRDSDNIPRGWVSMMKASLNRLCPMFNTHRMVEEYWDRVYVPAAEQGFRLMDKEHEALKVLALWREKIMYNWANIAIRNIRMQELEELEVGASYQVDADIYLGDLSPEDVVVEAYCGKLDPDNQYQDRFTIAMAPSDTNEDHTYHYHSEIKFSEAGHIGLNIRIIPNHPNEQSRHAMGLVIWGGD
jgi:starch phosphorylase